MAESGLEDQALGEEAVRRGLLSPEHLAEARETQRLAVDAGLPISLAEVLIQRKYLNTVQIESLQQRLREQKESPPAPTGGPPPTSPVVPPADGAAKRGSTTGPKPPVEARPRSGAIGPFPPIPDVPGRASEPTSKRGTGRISSLPTGLAKRGSGRSSAVSAQRASSADNQAVAPMQHPTPAIPTGKRGSARLAVEPSASADPPGSAAEEAKVPGTRSVGAAGVKGHAHRTSTRTPDPVPLKASGWLLWALPVLLLLIGSNAATWYMAGRPEPPPPITQEPALGPVFAPLTYWMVVGPFPVKAGIDLSTVHPPEEPDRDLTAVQKGGREPLKWKLVRMLGNRISFDRELGAQTNCNGYGLTYIECPGETKAQLGIGGDDTVRVWLNGEVVYENLESRKCVVDDGQVPVTLKAGPNEILVKIGQSTGEWGFALTLRAADKKPIPGLTGRLPGRILLPEPVVPPKRPVPPVRTGTKT